MSQLYRGERVDNMLTVQVMLKALSFFGIPRAQTRISSFWLEQPTKRKIHYKRMFPGSPPDLVPGGGEGQAVPRR